MKDSYGTKDLQYQKNPSLLKKEVIGPSLRDIEMNKRFNFHYDPSDDFQFYQKVEQKNMGMF